MDEAFERALLKIAPQLRVPIFRLVPILNGHKKPEGRRWSTKANYPYDHGLLAGYLAEGHNYGVLTGIGGLVVLDVDDLARLEALGIIGKLPETFTVRTGRGGLHFYLICSELKDKIILEDPEMKDCEGDPLHLGELQALGQQVVGPGSRHPNGNFYEVVKDLPIATIERAELLQILGPLKAKEAEEKRESRRRSCGGSSLGDLIPIDQVTWPKDINERCGSEVRGSHPLHDSKSGKNFAVNTAKNSWHCFRHKSGGGPLEWLAVEAGLISCQDAKPGCLGDKALFKKVLQIARDRGFEIPEPEKKKEEAKGSTVIDALKAILSHEAEAESDKDFQKWAWRMHKSRIEVIVRSGEMSQKREEEYHKFLKDYKNTLSKFGIDYNDLYPINRKPNNKEEFAPEIREKALTVLKSGNPVQYIADSCGKMVLGAEKAFKKLACGISIQNINQSYGFHPKLNGDSSGGKTYTVYTFAHHMPREAVIKGSMSAKAGFYHNDGNRVFRILDDYQAGNEDLDTVIKQTSSEFHAEYTHRTVANHEGKTLTIGSEQTWAITSVDSSQEIQVLNRQVPINVDDSLDLTAKVNELTIKRYADGERQYPVTENVLVSRCIFQILRDEGYIDVRVPFGDRITWLDTTNRRNPSLFMDLVVAFAGMFRYQRERDSEGYYLATEDDFQAAKALFTDKDGEELVKRLTKKERETLEFLVSRPEGITQDDLAERLKVSRQRAGQILFGQPKGSGGLMGKVPIKESSISDTITIGDGERRTIHKTVYSLKDYDKFAGFDAIVRLEPLSSEPCNSCKDGARDDARANTASSNDDERDEREKREEREKKIEKGLHLPSSLKGQALHESEVRPCKPCTVAHDSDERPCTVLFSPLQPLHHDETMQEAAQSQDPAEKGISSDFSPTEAALLKRICGRMRQQHPDKPINAFELAVLMRSNELDIGIERCKEWIKLEAGV